MTKADALCKYAGRKHATRSAFDSLGVDEFQCQLFVILKPAPRWFLLLVYPCEDISGHHVPGVLGAGAWSLSAGPVPLLPPSLWSPRVPSVPFRSRPPPLPTAGGGGCSSQSSGPALSAGAPCGRLCPLPLGPASLRAMAVAAASLPASPPAAAAVASTAAADAIVP